MTDDLKVLNVADLKVEVVGIESIKPDPDNAKIHTPEQITEIAASIKAFGFNDPIGIVRDMIVEGEGRWLAMKLLQQTEIPIIRLDHLSDEQRRAYGLAHNHLNTKTGFDQVKLKFNLTTIKITGMDLKPIGFSTLDLKKIFADPQKESDDAAALAEANGEDGGFVPFSQLGDVWTLGNHRVLCGDSTSPEAVALVMNGRQADLVLTDPPYNVSYTGKTADALTIENDKMDATQFRQFLLNFYKAAIDVTKPGGAIYIFHADSEGYAFRGAMLEAGWLMKQCLVWVKNVMVMGRQDYQWRHEPVLYGWKPGASHKWMSDRKQTTILSFNRPSRNAEHPTMKPIDLIEYLMRNSSEIEDVVFEPFGGSGSTLIAAEQAGRHCRCIELSPRYVSVIVQRWANLTKKDPVLHRGGSILSLADAQAAALGNGSK